MNAKLFSEAINEVNDKYYEEAANYHCKKYRWKKWSIVAACLAAVLVLCGFCYAAYIYWGAGPAKNIDFADLTQPLELLPVIKMYLQMKMSFSMKKATSSMTIQMFMRIIPSVSQWMATAFRLFILVRTIWSSLLSQMKMAGRYQKVMNFPLTSLFLRKYSWILGISSMGSITKLHLVERDLTLAI